MLCAFVLYFSDDKNPYFEVDLGYPDEIKGVATQGNGIQDGKYWFVRSFAMSFSLNGKTWFNYTGDGPRTKVSVEECVLQVLSYLVHFGEIIIITTTTTKNELIFRWIWRELRRK